MFLSLLCLLLVTSPHVYWALTNMQATLSQAGKFHMGHSLGLFASYSQGFERLLKAVVAFLGVLFPVYIIFFYKQGKQDVTAAENSDSMAYVSLIRRMLLTGLFLCVLMILFFKVTAFKDRWMQPLLFATPLYLVTLSWERFTLTNARRYIGLTFFIALAVLLVLSGRTLCASQLGRLSRLNSPYAAFAAQLRQTGFQSGLIIAEDRLVGGNVKLFFPESVIVAPEVPASTVPPDIDRLIVWDATKSAEMPDYLHEFAGTLLSADSDQLPAQYIQAPYKYVADRSMRLGFLLVKKDKP